MMNSWMLRWVGLGLCLALGACSQPPTASNSPANPASVTPTPQPNVARVIALTSLTADLVQRLDGKKLVGIPGSSLLRQDQRFKALPTVSEGRTSPNLEAIVALQPDLVIGASSFHADVAKRLNESGIRTLLTEVNSWENLETLTTTLAATLSADPEPLLQEYRAFLADAPKMAPSTLVLANPKPLLSPNKASWAGDTLARFGAKNVAADLQGGAEFSGYALLSPEKVLEVNPEVIILVSTGEGVVEQFKSNPIWNQLKAVSNNRVYVLDYYGLVNPGSIDAIKQACTTLKQQVFANQPGIR
ncbi:ABC transporter substrate-binding protein [Myxacorys almedinensis A]|uniref:ABC transporter substrate-binding protein n=2 Tax=Myxacorys TaxID=2056239 RepID=A0A8J7Z2J5_9CYAN|nr:ABC transporter substrate-binding protein [Myxacorys almedinensis A]